MMARNKGLIWDKQKSVDKGKVWIDYASSDGHWCIAEGQDELERKANELAAQTIASLRAAADKLSDDLNLATRTTGVAPRVSEEVAFASARWDSTT